MIISMYVNVFLQNIHIYIYFCLYINISDVIFPTSKAFFRLPPAMLPEMGGMPLWQPLRHMSRPSVPLEGLWKPLVFLGGKECPLINGWNQKDYPFEI